MGSIGTPPHTVRVYHPATTTFGPLKEVRMSKIQHRRQGRGVRTHMAVRVAQGIFQYRHLKAFGKVNKICN